MTDKPLSISPFESRTAMSQGKQHMEVPFGAGAYPQSSFTDTKHNCFPTFSQNAVQIVSSFFQCAMMEKMLRSLAKGKQTGSVTVTYMKEDKWVSRRGIIAV